MKLAKVSHYQCDEYNGTSYVWIPDDMNVDDFFNIVDKTQTAYMAYLKEWKTTQKVSYVGHFPNYKDYPKNLTIEEIDKQHAIALEKYKEWVAKEAKSKYTFSHFLEEAGFKLIWDYEPDCSITLDWGHNHGMGLDYEEEFPKDFSFNKKEGEEESLY